MSSDTSRIQLERGRNLFIKEETTAGTYIQPVAGDIVVPAGGVVFNQVPSYTDSAETRNSRSLVDRFTDMDPAGSFSIPMYCRPSGTAGDVPDGSVLLKNAFGKETITGGTSVVYGLSMSDTDIGIGTFSVTLEYQDMAFGLFGCVVNEMKISFNNKGAVMFTFSGMFQSALRCGRVELDATSTAGTALEVPTGEAKKFSVGMAIKYSLDAGATWEDNTTGYPITAVNETTDILTLGTALDDQVDSGDIVAPFVATAGTEVGSALSARTASVNYDSTSMPLVGFDFTLNNGIKFLEDEISSATYPTEYIRDRRSASASTQIYMRPDDLTLFRKGQAQASANMNATVGVADDQMVLTMAQAVPNVPTMSGDLQKMLSVDFTGLATSSLEDECQLAFL